MTSRTVKRVVVTLFVVSVAAVAAGAGTASGASGSCSYPFSKVDATGTNVTVNDEPQRIVTLAPSAAQTVWEIGGKEKVVGITTLATYLNGTENKSKIGNGFSFDIEKIVNLTPDIILAPNVTPKRKIQEFREAGLTVYHFRKAKSLSFVYGKTRITGKLVGKCDSAAKVASETRRQVEKIRQTVRDETKVDVLYAAGSGFTTGDETFIHDVLTSAGGENIAANIDSKWVSKGTVEGYYQISVEKVILEDPNWMVASFPSAILESYNVTTAIKKNQTVIVNPNYISQPAPRVVRPLRKIANSFHPDRFSQNNAGGRRSSMTSPTKNQTDLKKKTQRKTNRSRKVQKVRLRYNIERVNQDVIRTVFLNVPSTVKTGVRGVAMDSLPNSVSSLPENTVGVLEIDSSTTVNGTGNVTMEIVLSKNALGKRISPRVYRYHGGWNPLKTTVGNLSGDTVTISAETPALSYFAVVNKPEKENETMTSETRNNQKIRSNETDQSQKNGSRRQKENKSQSQNQNPSPGFTVAVGLVAAVVAAVAVRRRSE